MKKNFILLSTFAALMVSAILLTACGDEVQMPEKDSTEPEISTETTASTIFSTGVDGTRTKMDANRQFYWTNGDQIYVNTEGAKYKKTTSSTLYENDKKANFVLEGVKLIAEKCSVMYIGNGMASTQTTADASKLKVKIEAEQRQTAWDNSDHIGPSGDCGVAEATRDETTGKYSFKLQHKAAYLIFQPYKDAQITANWKLIKIEIISNNRTNLTGTYDFGTGELVGTGSSNTIKINCNSTIDFNNVATGGFDLSDQASAANSCFAVIAPGNHKLTIRYTVQPEGSMNDVAGATFTIDKEIPAVNADGSRTYNPNGVTTIKHKLDVMLFNLQYYQWDALNPYGSPTGTDFNTIEYPRNTSQLTTNRAQNSCKDMPNVNEMYGYERGATCFDETTPWALDGGSKVYTGGMWVMKKQVILDEGIPFRDDIGKDDVDMRLVFRYSYGPFPTGVLPAAERSKYFFLPAMGYYDSEGWPYEEITSENSWLVNRGQYGCYWTSSPCPGYDSDGVDAAAYSLQFSAGNIQVSEGRRHFYGIVAPELFQ